jgi:phosphoglucomutase
MPPEDADALTRFVRDVENPLEIEVLSDDEIKDSELITIIGEEVDTEYLKEIKSVTINQELINEMGKELKLVYTPLHGTGKMLGEKALAQAGFEKFVLVPEQAVADPDFSTVKSPNPEEHSAFEYAIKLGEQEGADLLIATDPDADRLGAAVRLPDGRYEVLTGNQIGAIMIRYILEAHKQAGTLPENAVVLKSIVSSELATTIADSYKVKMIDVLTGFKFIAEKIQQYEEDHSQTFMFGFEESYGYLIKSFVRDKDAIQALVLLAEVAAYYKKQGKTLYDGLQDIFEEYGYYAEKTISVTLSGEKGAEEIKAIMGNLRSESPKSFANTEVVLTEDFKTSKAVSADGSEKSIDMPSSDVLKYTLADETWLAIRPSGTEPKIKFYIGVKGDSHEAAAEKIATYEEAIRKIAE